MSDLFTKKIQKTPPKITQIFQNNLILINKQTKKEEEIDFINESTSPTLNKDPYQTIWTFICQLHPLWPTIQLYSALSRLITSSSCKKNNKTSIM